MIARVVRSLGWLAEGAVLLAVISAVLALLDVPTEALRPHPYGLAVLLVALHRGTIPAVAVAVAATLLLLPSLPAQEFGQDWNSYLLGLLREPLLWCVVLLLAGSFTDRQRLRRDQAEEAAARAQDDMAAMLARQEAMVATCRTLEAAVASQGTTAVRILDAARALGDDEGSAIAGTLGLLALTTGATASALYLYEGAGLQLASADGEAEEPAPDPALLEVLSAGRDCLVANRAEDRALLGRALMAGALRSPDGRMLGVLVIHAMPFRRFGLDAVANFTAVCAWVGDLLAQKRARVPAQEGDIVPSGRRFIAPNSAPSAARFMLAVARRFQLDLTSIDIGLTGDRLADVPLMTEAILQVFRCDDMLLQARRDGTAVHALLLGADVAGAWQAEARLRAAVAEVNPLLAGAMRTQVSALHVPRRSEAA